MGRLTYMHDGKWCINGVNGKLTGDNQANYWGEAVDQLAAYENTRMEPCDYNTMRAAMEQCEEAKKQLSELIHIVGATGINRIQELAQADKTGRLEVLPCKIGDWVYALWDVPTEYKYVIYCAEVKEIRHSVRNCRATTTYGLEPIEYRGRIKEYRDDDFGKTVFLTNEEAEAALRKEKRE